jgi:hypothetical protein
MFVVSCLAIVSIPGVIPQHVLLCCILLSSLIGMVEMVGTNVDNMYPHHHHHHHHKSHKVNSVNEEKQSSTSRNDPLALHRIRPCGFIPVEIFPIGLNHGTTSSPNIHFGASLDYFSGDIKSQFHETTPNEYLEGRNDTSEEMVLFPSSSSSASLSLPDAAVADVANVKTVSPIAGFLPPPAARHYACPPTTLESLRKRYGHRRSVWGEWSNREARVFYKTQLPRALQIDGALGLTLEERAQLASEARHALRMYSRERCRLPGRLVARLYDGMRHLIYFGSWAPDGMTWMEVKQKYSVMAKSALPADQACDPDAVELYVYRKIVERACCTNQAIDKFAERPLDFIVDKLTLPQLKDLVLNSIVHDSITQAVDVFEELTSPSS